jgi:hypothetical protein
VGWVCTSLSVGCVPSIGWLGGLQKLIFSRFDTLKGGDRVRVFIERDKNRYYLLQYICICEVDFFTSKINEGVELFQSTEASIQEKKEYNVNFQEQILFPGFCLSGFCLFKINRGRGVEVS